MYKVLLVDDEPTIREGLRTLIEWEELGYYVVDTGSNGKDALAKYEKFKPDLIIIDIRMPGMSGLEVIERIRESDKSVHIIILSGYADFDYAKRAISSKADGYLLKPVDEDELIGYLKRVRKTIDQERASERGGAAVDWTPEMVIQSLLTGGYRDMLIEAADRAGLNWKAYEVVLIRPLSRHLIDAADIQHLKEMLAQLYDQKERGAVFTLDPHLGIVVKNGVGGEEMRESLWKELNALFSSMGLDFAAAAGGIVHEWPEVERSYHQAVQVLHYRFFLEAGIVHDRTSLPAAGPVTSDEPHEVHVDLSDLTDKLYLAVDIANIESIHQLIEQAGVRMKEAALGEEEVKGHYAQMASTAAARLVQHRAGLQEAAHELSNGLLELYKDYRYSDAAARVNRLLEQLAERADTSSADKQVNRMIDIIRRNYHENLKLETIAELLNYNSAYLGKLFKNVTGEYFNTYLDKVRIEHAKELLDQGMKVYQVAEKIGYTNVDYFHSKFRKYVGMSPSAYRKK